MEKYLHTMMLPLMINNCLMLCLLCLSSPHFLYYFCYYTQCTSFNSVLIAVEWGGMLFPLMHSRAATRLEPMELERLPPIWNSLSYCPGFTLHHFCSQSYSIVLWCSKFVFYNSGNYMVTDTVQPYQPLFEWSNSSFNGFVMCFFCVHYNNIIKLSSG